MNRFICSSLVLLGVASPVSAQFFDSLTNPKIDVPVEHPATLPLRISAIGFGAPEGRCADSLLGRIEADFVQHGTTVVDRAHIKKVLAEQKLQVSGLVDEKTAVGVGKLLGAQVLVFLKVSQCATTPSTRTAEEVNLIERSKVNRTYYIRSGKISGSLRVIDLTTGRVLGAQNFAASKRLESTDTYPDEANVIEGAEVDAVRSIHKMFLPWTEVRSLVFYDDKECNLKAAYQHLRVDNILGAYHQSEANLNECKNNAAVKPRGLARAYYNLGIVQFLRRDYDAALASLSESAKLQSGDIVFKAIAECGHAKEMASAPSGQLANQAAPRPSPAANTSIEERLQQIEGLKKKGVITQAEYSQKRAEILNDI